MPLPTKVHGIFQTFWSVALALPWRLPTVVFQLPGMWPRSWPRFSNGMLVL